MDAANPVISTAQLQDLLQKKLVTVVDVTYTLKPNVPDWKTYKSEYYGQFHKLIKKFGEDAYEKEHIPGAVHFSLDVGLFVGEYKRFDLYPEELFAKYVGKLGISPSDHIVVYGRDVCAGMLFAAHAWWIFKYYGFKNVQVLDGGIEAWKASGGSVTNMNANPEEKSVKLTIDKTLAVSFEELHEKVANNAPLIDRLETINAIDGRPREQYSGAAPQPLPNKEKLKGFHIKGAKCLPAMDLTNREGLKALEELKRLFGEAGYIDGKPAIAYCGVGNQGSLVLLALHRLGFTDSKLYQGGMTEMAHRDPANIS